MGVNAQEDPSETPGTSPEEIPTTVPPGESVGDPETVILVADNVTVDGGDSAGWEPSDFIALASVVALAIGALATVWNERRRRKQELDLVLAATALNALERERVVLQQFCGFDASIFAEIDAAVDEDHTQSAEALSRLSTRFAEISSLARQIPNLDVRSVCMKAVDHLGALLEYLGAGTRGGKLHEAILINSEKATRALEDALTECYDRVAAIHAREVAGESVLRSPAEPSNSSREHRLYPEIEALPPLDEAPEGRRAQPRPPPDDEG